MNSRQRKAQKQPKKSKQQRRGPPRDVPRTVVSRSPYLMPERYSARLTFATTLQINNAGFKDAAYVLRPSSVYDVDPAIGGASAFGLAEFSQFYSRYKVHSSVLTINIGNLEPEPVTVFLTPSLDNPGNNPSDIGPWFASTVTRMKSLGPYNGNGAASLRHSFVTQALTGVDFYADDAYAAPVNNSPASNTYWILGAVKTGPNNFSTGLGVAVVLKMVITVHFYGRKPLVSPAAKIHRVSDETALSPPPIPVFMVAPPTPFTPTPPPIRSVLAQAPGSPVIPNQTSQVADKAQNISFS